MTRRVITILCCVAALAISSAASLWVAYLWSPADHRGKLVSIKRVLGLLARPTEQDYRSARITYEYKSGGVSIDTARTRSLSIYADGTVTIEDAPYGQPIRRLRYSISQAQVRDLVDAFYRIDYFALEDEYEFKRTGGSISHISDGDTVITSLTTESHEKRVRAYWGAPRELTDLEQLIERTVLDPGLQDGVELAIAPERAQPGSIVSLRMIVRAR